MKGLRTWNLLIVDDEEKICEQVQEYLESSTTASGEKLAVKTETNFHNSLAILENHIFDLLIMDVRLGSHTAPGSGEEAGINVYNRIRETRFIPIIFYTGLPHLVSDLKLPLVEVVEKTEDLDSLLRVINDILQTKLPLVNRELLRHVAEIQRKYMWEFVLPNWNMFGDSPDKSAIAHLLARRLAKSLSESGLKMLAEKLGEGAGAPEDSELAHPMRYYIMPPVEGQFFAGDIFSSLVDGQKEFWLLLNPSCDMIIGRIKCDLVLLAKCILLRDAPEYVKWADNPSNTATKELKALMGNNRIHQPERFHFLPGVFSIPDLIVDFQQVRCVPFDYFEQLSGLTREASLDSPFGEEILARFARYFGRIGSPDLNLDIVLQRQTGAPET